jgi:cation:H+ antiporter
MTIAAGQLILGLIILSVGGHYLVRGAISIALLARISTAVVGLTVVALGTSLPELAVSVNAAARGSTDISYANVVGSNIFNVAVILSLVTFVHPISASREVLRFHYPAMFIALVLGVVLAGNRLVGHVEGIFMLSLLAVFVTYSVRASRRANVPRRVDPEEQAALEDEVRETGAIKGSALRAWTISAVLIILGGFALAFGADLMVRGAVTIARTMGVTERVIGLTVIAMGTSLPELAASIMAAVHGKHDITLSNLLGSNIFNVLGILGTTSAIFPVPVNVQAATLDNWVMLAFAAALFPVLKWGKKVTRLEALLLLTAFAVYMVVVVRG